MKNEHSRNQWSYHDGDNASVIPHLCCLSTLSVETNEAINKNEHGKSSDVKFSQKK